MGKVEVSMEGVESSEERAQSIGRILPDHENVIYVSCDVEWLN